MYIINNRMEKLNYLYTVKNDRNSKNLLMVKIPVKFTGKIRKLTFPEFPALHFKFSMNLMFFSMKNYVSS